MMHAAEKRGENRKKILGTQAGHMLFIVEKKAENVYDFIMVVMKEFLFSSVSKLNKCECFFRFILNSNVFINI